MMLKYALIAIFMVLAGLGLWFFRLPGPNQLELADRWWPGAAEQAGAPRLGIAYGQGARQRLDIYQPEGAGPKPVLLFLHGGSWRDGDSAAYAFVGRAFAARGFVTVIADYRKYPSVKFPDFVEDAAAAAYWTHKNIDRFGGDPDRLFVMGHSAGAHLAALVAMDPKWLKQHGADHDIIKGVVGLAGPYDFYPFTNEAAQAALGDWPIPNETQPIFFARSDAPPMLLLHGDQDETVKPRNSTAMAAVMRDVGGVATAKIYPGIDHADIVMAIARPFRKKAPVIQDAIAFMVND
jgi:acetyl esterase/lipase